VSEPEEEEKRKKRARERRERRRMKAGLDTERSLTLFSLRQAHPLRWARSGSLSLLLRSSSLVSLHPPQPSSSTILSKRKETTSSWSRTLARSVFHSSFPSLGRLSPSPPPFVLFFLSSPPSSNPVRFESSAHSSTLALYQDVLLLHQETRSLLQEICRFS